MTPTDPTDRAEEARVALGDVDRIDIALRMLAEHRATVRMILQTTVRMDTIWLCFLGGGIVTYWAFLGVLILGQHLLLALVLLIVASGILLFGALLQSARISIALEYDFARFQCERYFAVLDDMLRSTGLPQRAALLRGYAAAAASLADEAKGKAKRIQLKAVDDFVARHETGTNAVAIHVEALQKAKFLSVFMLLLGVILLLLRYRLSQIEWSPSWIRAIGLG